MNLYRLNDADKKVLAAIEQGLPIDPHPYALIGKSINMSEDEVIERITILKQNNIIRRLGVIIHHRPLGYQANAMVVWKFNEEQTITFGEEVSQLDFVTLCYQRSADLPVWPYTIYTMIHGKDRESVLKRVEILKEFSPESNPNYKVLFSKRRFKQQGARYFNQIDPIPAIVH